MTKHNAPTPGSRVSVRAYLLAGVPVVGAGVITASPSNVPSPAEDTSTTALTASTADLLTPDAIAPASAPSQAEGVAAAAAATSQPASSAVVSRPGLQLSLLTGTPNLGFGVIALGRPGTTDAGLDNGADAGTDSDGADE